MLKHVINFFTKDTAFFRIHPVRMLFDRGSLTNIRIMLEDICTCGHIREEGTVLGNQLNDIRSVWRLQTREMDLQAGQDC